MKNIFSLIISCLILASCSSSQPQMQAIEKSSPKASELDSKQLSLADDIINEAITKGEIPGAVLAIVRHDKLAYIKAYGNKQTYPTTVAMTENTVFDIASLSKSVSTAISTMILVERGQLSLNDKVSTFIPDFKPWINDTTKQKKEIKVIDLLTHTSGLPAYVSEKTLISKYKRADKYALSDFIATEATRRTEPSTNFDYSCLNFITLQRIIETVSKKTLQVFAQENIFIPLGMKHTDYNPTGETLVLTAPTQKMADGTVLLGKVHDPLARINGGVSGNAGIFSNAEDLSILASMLLNKGTYKGVRILSPLTVAKMQSTPRGYEQFGRALGWDMYSSYASNIGDLFSPATYGHTGYTGTSMIIDPETETAIILLTNRVHPNDKGSVTRLRTAVANIVAGSITEL